MVQVDIVTCRVEKTSAALVNNAQPCCCAAAQPHVARPARRPLADRPCRPPPVLDRRHRRRRRHVLRNSAPRVASAGRAGREDQARSGPFAQGGGRPSVSGSCPSSRAWCRAGCRCPLASCGNTHRRQGRKIRLISSTSRSGCASAGGGRGWPGSGCCRGRRRSPARAATSARSPASPLP